MKMVLMYSRVVIDSLWPSPNSKSSANEERSAELSLYYIIVSEKKIGGKG